MNKVSTIKRLACVGVLLLAGGALRGQNPPPAAQPAAAPAAPAAAPPAEGGFTKEQLEQLVAPIALYPDGLLTQVFMAATYPLQIVEANRFMDKNPDLKGDALNEQLKGQDWDEAVKSICTFPDVLKKMSDNLDWTQDLGDAMLGQQTELLDAVQVMRNKAYDGGKLESTEQINVTVEQQASEPNIIVIESKDPEVVYVPQYAPSAMYPGWGYPSYYYPSMYPYYPPGAGFWSFTAGVIVGGAIWGNCNWGWGHSDVDIDINRNNNFNRNTNINGGNRVQNTGGNRQNWQHNPENRKGVNYRDGATAQKYGGTGASSRVSSQEARGRSEGSAGTRQAGAGAGTREGAGTRQGGASAGTREGAAGARQSASAGTRDTAGSGARQSASAGTRDTAGAASRQSASAGSRDASAGSRASSSSASRPSTSGASRSGSSSSRPSSSSYGGSSGSRSSAYSGARSPSTARASSSRGSMSRGGGGMSRGGGGRRR
jgi:Protein of unknown function (DUF3300)